MTGHSPGALAVDLVDHCVQANVCRLTVATLLLLVLRAQPLVLSTEFGEFDARLLAYCGERDLGLMPADAIGRVAGHDAG